MSYFQIVFNGVDIDDFESHINYYPDANTLHRIADVTAKTHYEAQALLKSFVLCMAVSSSGISNNEVDDYSIQVVNNELKWRRYQFVRGGNGVTTTEGDVIINDKPANLHTVMCSLFDKVTLGDLIISIEESKL